MNYELKQLHRKKGSRNSLIETRPKVYRCDRKRLLKLFNLNDLNDLLNDLLNNLLNDFLNGLLNDLLNDLINDLLNDLVVFEVL